MAIQRMVVQVFGSGGNRRFDVIAAHDIDAFDIEDSEGRGR
jgi:hypothetical protein